MGLGKKIAILRQEKGLTQKDLAKKAKISESYLSRIEEEVINRPHVKTVYRIASCLNISVHELMKIK